MAETPVRSESRNLSRYLGLAMVSGVLIVEDDKGLCAAIAREALRWGSEVIQAHSAKEALERLAANPALLIVDVRLPDGNGLDVVEAAGQRRPVPTMIAISGQASPEEAFRLAQAGVRGYLSKPLSAQDLIRAVEEALHDAPALGHAAVAAVGRTPLRDAQEQVRSAMIEQALASADGNFSETARLLNVSRQAVQQMAQARGADRDPKPVESPEESWHARDHTSEQARRKS